MVSLAKRVLIGRPIATSEEGHQRLRKRVALPIFASDAMSSTAYATDEILHVLLLSAGVGAIAFDRLVPIAIVVPIGCECSCVALRHDGCGGWREGRKLNYGY